MMLETPVVLLMFKRERIVDIIERLRVVKPRKLYLVSDGGRTEKEQEQVDFRKLAENAIDWECDVVKRYAESNKGVFDNIAGGAKWVFEREETAIFLEDDNLPEVSFFQYCEEMLAKYKQNPKFFGSAVQIISAITLKQKTMKATRAITLRNAFYLAVGLRGHQSF